MDKSWIGRIKWRGNGWYGITCCCFTTLFSSTEEKQKHWQSGNLVGVSDCTRREEQVDVKEIQAPTTVARLRTPSCMHSAEQTQTCTTKSQRVRQGVGLKECGRESGEWVCEIWRGCSDQGFYVCVMRLQEPQRALKLITLIPLTKIKYRGNTLTVAAALLFQSSDGLSTRKAARDILEV